MTRIVTGDLQAAEEVALVRGVIAHPDEDLPRLVYADWLDEHGQPARAEFIRLQCHLARLPAADPTRIELQEREASILREHGLAWQLPLIGLGATAICFDRGFPTALRIFAPALLAHADRIFAIAPVAAVTVENLDGTGEQFERFLSLPQLTCLTSLTVQAGLRDDEVARLAACPRLEQLIALNLRGNLIGPEGSRALAASPFLSRLRSLSLSANFITDDAVHALVKSPTFTSLTALDVSANQITDRGAEAIAGSSSLARLETLDLGTNYLGPAGALALANSANLPALRRVHLQHNRIGAQAIDLIAHGYGGRRSDSASRHG